MLKIINIYIHSGSLYSGDTKSNSFLHYNELYTKKKSHHIVYFNNISCDIHYNEFKKKSLFCINTQGKAVKVFKLKKKKVNDRKIIG